MRGIILGILLAAKLSTAEAGMVGPSESCLRAASIAEQRWLLPVNLLLAIGRVESGRRDEASGKVEPWPWSANAAGSDYFFTSVHEARTVVGFLRERGIASIDVGCFQVNLQHHPDAFASVEEAFDPYANADYAARFLRVLFERSGSWAAAIGRYHSADPGLGDAYRTKVLRAWHDLRAQSPMPSEDPRASRVALLSRAGPPIPVYTSRTLPQALRATFGLGEYISKSR